MRVNKKYVVAAVLLFTTLTVYAMSKTKRSFFYRKMFTRGCDSGGCGEFGASRGDRKHLGLDIACFPDEGVVTPFDGEVIRTIDPYGDGKYSGLKINTTNGFILNIMYLDPIDIVGTTVNKGDLVGYAQDVSKRYSSGVKPHLHVEIEVNGRHVDPYPYLF